jgi:hypothetical protein
MTDNNLILPLEILHVIAACHVESYRALLAIPVFARSVVTTHHSKVIDYMIHFGYSVKIGNYAIYWHLNGLSHRINGPAIEWINGDRDWCVNGERHRINGPAIEWINGNKEWWWFGKRHRVDGPAIIYANGNKEWWQNGKLHRPARPGEPVEPAVVYTDGLKEWWQNGKKHRDNGPAVVYSNGYKQWWQNGVLYGQSY